MTRRDIRPGITFKQTFQIVKSTGSLEDQLGFKFHGHGHEVLGSALMALISNPEVAVTAVH